MSRLNLKSDYIPLEGGLDLEKSALAVKAGFLSEVQNFEQVFGKQGYRRVDGYERFDGKPYPSTATYSVQKFKNGTSAIAVGDIVTGGAVSGKVLAITLSSGSWGAGTAAGTLILGRVTSSFVDGENINSSGVKAVADGTTSAGSIAEADDTTYKSLAVEDRRADILKVPGEGKILGVCVYGGIVYAVRNNVGGLSAQMWKSSVSGWVSVKDGLYPGGEFRFCVTNFTGTTTTIAMYGVDGRNRSFKWDGTTFTFMSPIYGSQATSTSSLAIGTGSKTFSVAQTTRSYVVGDEVVAWSSADASKRMSGTVTGYTHPNLTVNVTSTVGTGTFADWEIGKAAFTDKPIGITAHKNHMWLSYPLGQLQTSNLGDPMTYTTSAALFGTGDEITGVVSMKGGVLGVFCLSHIYIISGSSLTDWSMAIHSNSAGAKYRTVQENVGNAIFWDRRGLTTLQSTLNFGSFEPSIFSRKVRSVLDANESNIADTAIISSKYQYRIFTKTGYVITAAIMSANPQFGQEDVSFSVSKYPHNVTCVFTSDFGSESGALFFGTDDGYIMHGDTGTSFDGVAIESVLRTHFHQFKSPSVKKRLRKMSIEMESDSAVDIYFRQQFDYSNDFYASNVTQTTQSTGVGGSWDVDGWDKFRWSKPIVSQADVNIDGIGKNMGIILWHSSATDQPFFIQGLLISYSMIGVAR